MRNIASTFWSMVDKGPGCWNFRGPRVNFGYGQFRQDHLCIAAHRLAYILSVGPIPAGKLVCHTCDNPPCVNPLHLFPGTGKDNMDDMVAKGRWRGPVGSRVHQSKLTEAQASEIRKRYTGARGEQSALAREFGVNVNTIHLLVHGRTWKAVLND